jgi:hypothetical protein
MGNSGIDEQNERTCLIVGSVSVATLLVVVPVLMGISAILSENDHNRVLTAAAAQPTTAQSIHWDQDPVLESQPLDESEEESEDEIDEWNRCVEIDAEFSDMPHSLIRDFFGNNGW